MTVVTAYNSLAAADAMNAAGQRHLNAMNVAIAARQQASFSTAQQLAIAGAVSPYVVRPLTWNLGRGYLIVRKSDGAFAEVVTGPSDLYDAQWREASATAFVPGARTLVTFTEGLASKDWVVQDATPVKVVGRRLMGFGVDPANFRPASEYANSSKVPDGSYAWLEDVRGGQ